MNTLQHRGERFVFQDGKSQNVKKTLSMTKADPKVLCMTLEIFAATYRPVLDATYGCEDLQIKRRLWIDSLGSRIKPDTPFRSNERGVNLAGAKLSSGHVTGGRKFAAAPHIIGIRQSGRSEAVHKILLTRESGNEIAIKDNFFPVQHIFIESKGGSGGNR